MIRLQWKSSPLNKKKKKVHEKGFIAPDIE